MNRANNSLSNDKHEMCHLLVDQFTSVFTIPYPQQIITDPVSFFAFDKVDHGILLHKLRAVAITGNIGIWLFHLILYDCLGVLVKTTLC